MGHDPGYRRAKGLTKNMHSRIAILGNAGSGKSYLASKIGVAWGLPIIDLDALFWMPGGYTEKRPSVAVDAELAKRKTDDRWIIEGVFGELIAQVLDRANLLLWLDFDWTTCRASLVDRHSNAAEEERHRKDETFRVLLDYAEAYWSRGGPRSQSGHAALFHEFAGAKRRLRDRGEVAAFLCTL